MILVLITASILNDALSKLDAWFRDNSLGINFEKTNCMLFHKSNDHVNAQFQITCRGNDIERVYSFKYLGIILDPNLSFRNHFLYVKSVLAPPLEPLIT